MLTSKTFMEGQGPTKILWFGAKTAGPGTYSGKVDSRSRAPPANLAFVPTTWLRLELSSFLLFFFTLFTHG